MHMVSREEQYLTANTGVLIYVSRLRFSVT